MSYSFTVRASDKQAAKTAIAAKLEEVVATQACHHRDKAQAQAAADAFVDLLSDDDGKDIVVNINGYLTGHWEGSDVTRIEGASIGVSAGLSKREEVPA
ncbi:MAG: hypothetical protein V4706_01695 [Pseudomonadota bacterium]